MPNETNETNVVPQVWYFGCIGQSGHHLFESAEGQARSVRYMPKELEERFGYQGRRLDGTFCPPQKWGTGIIYVSQVPPFTIISWWDNSVDSRPGSHSTFVGKFVHNREDLVRLAKDKFPEVFKRQPEPRIGLHLFT